MEEQNRELMLHELKRLRMAEELENGTEASKRKEEEERAAKEYEEQERRLSEIWELRKADFRQRYSQGGFYVPPGYVSDSIATRLRSRIEAAVRRGEIAPRDAANPAVILELLEPGDLDKMGGQAALYWTAASFHSGDEYARLSSFAGKRKRAPRMPRANREPTKSRETRRVENVAPPRGAMFLLLLLLPKDRAEDCIGDFDEIFRVWSKRLGRRLACLLYWSQVMRALGPFLKKWCRAHLSRRLLLPFSGLLKHLASAIDRKADGK